MKVRFSTKDIAKGVGGKLASATRGRARVIPSKKEKAKRKRVKYVYRYR